MSTLTSRRFGAAAALAGAGALAIAGTAVPATAADGEPGSYPAYGSSGNYTLTGTAAPFEVEAPVIVRPEDGDTATTATPPFSGTGLPGAVVEVTITCGEDSWTGTADVDDDGTWSFTPEDALPNGECTVSATQSINDATSPATDEIGFTIDVASDEPSDDDGADDGGEDDDLPDTGASSTNVVILSAGLVLLGLGAALYVRTRRTAANG